METADFFPKVRRELEIMDFHVLRSTGSERRAKTSVRMPLGGSQSVIGVPDVILSAREAVMKDRGIQKKIIFELEIEGETVTFFSTGEVKGKQQSFAGATLKQFSVERVGKDEKALVFLNFIIYSPTSVEQVSWLYKMLHETTFAEFDSTQAKFNYDKNADEEDENEDDGQEELPLDGKGPKLVKDPNDMPNEPIPGDKRQAIKPTDKPSARSAKGATKNKK